MAGNNNLELEIHSLFMQGSAPEHICNEIVSKYEKNDVLSPSEVESISHFLMTVGRYDILFKFYRKVVRKKSVEVFPWGYFAVALKDLLGFIPEDIIDLIDFSLKEHKTDATAYKVPELLDLIPQLSLRAKSIRQQFEIDQLQLKTKLITQLNHNRLYQLHEQEDQVLSQLVKNFPLDIEVRLLHQAHLEKKADEILSRVRAQRQTPRSQPKETVSTESAEFIEKLTLQVQKLADHCRTVSPEQIYNLALLCMNFELCELSLSILQNAPETFAGEWIKA